MSANDSEGTVSKEGEREDKGDIERGKGDDVMADNEKATPSPSNSATYPYPLQYPESVPSLAGLSLSSPLGGIHRVHPPFSAPPASQPYLALSQPTISPTSVNVPAPYPTPVSVPFTGRGVPPALAQTDPYWNSYYHYYYNAWPHQAHVPAPVQPATHPPSGFPAAWHGGARDAFLPLHGSPSPSVSPSPSASPGPGSTYSMVMAATAAAGKDDGLTLADCCQHGLIRTLASHQRGCRFLQECLEKASPEDPCIDFAFNELLSHMLYLSTDVFGNYVVQKFLEHGTHKHRQRLVRVLQGHIVALSLHNFGCRVVQKVVECVADEKARRDLLEELQGNVMKCVKDQSGVHVVQRCLEALQFSEVLPLIEEFRGHMLELCTHVFGCRIVQRMIEKLVPDDVLVPGLVPIRDDFFREITSALDMLIKDMYGNYVVQHLLQMAPFRYRVLVVDVVAPNLKDFSLHKYASNVVEKSFMYASNGEREILIAQLLGITMEELHTRMGHAYNKHLSTDQTPSPVAAPTSSPLPDGEDHDEGRVKSSSAIVAMVQDRFGNYVVQRALRTSTPVLRQVIIDHLETVCPNLRSLPYGHHISSLIQQFGGRSVVPPTLPPRGEQAAAVSPPPANHPLMG